MYHFRKGSKFLSKNGKISEEGQTSSTKMVPFQKWVKIVNENGTILVRKRSKILNKNGTISEKGQKSSTKMVPFQKRVKNPQQKWYHFRKWSKFLNKMVPFQKRVKNPQQKWYHFRKGSKILDKNGTISEEGQRGPFLHFTFHHSQPLPLFKFRSHNKLNLKMMLCAKK